MKLFLGTLIGLCAGIGVCVLWLTLRFFPTQAQYELALMRCDAEKAKVAFEVTKIRRYLGEVAR